MKWDLSEFENKDVVFVGAGKGRAVKGVQEFLNTHTQLASFTAVDKRSDEQPLAFLTEYDSSKTIFIKNEGVPGSELPVPYTTALQLFFRLVQMIGATTIGITGTKGKSTTTALTAHILETAGKHVFLAGNIGNSPLLQLDDATETSIFVLELSSYQLSDLNLSPHISACINLFNDHTDWHGSLESYWEAKHNIMRFAGLDDVFVYNPDFPTLNEWAMSAPCKSVAINKDESPDLLTDAALFGEHNRLNALIARQIARELDIDDDISLQAIHTFLPLEHRMEIVAIKNAKTYIDDAIGMTPESTVASLLAVSNKYGPIGCLLLGGQDRNYDFTALMETIASLNVPNLVLFPDTVEKMKNSLPVDYHPQIVETSNMSEAVAFAAKNSPEDSVVLLSTAAPSYSLWKDFEDKGNQFKEAVRNA